MTYEDKIGIVIQKMKEMGYTKVRHSRVMDIGFRRACRALGFNRETIIKYWGWFYENKIVPALEARK